MVGATSAEEKRQEERRIKELREFQRSNVSNRRCFDCNEMMPQYVCLDFNTFVCTSCSGIHREFAHRVKSISMSKFTETEVKNMIKFGGNEAAQKYWRAKHDASFRPSGGNNGERTRNFIRLTYIDRKWVYESPRNAKEEEKTKTSSKSKDKTSSSDDFFSSGSKASSAFDTFSTTAAGQDSGSNFANFGDFSDFSSDSKAPSNNFGDFGDFGDFGSSSTKSVQSDSGFGDFGDFESSSKPSAPAVPVRTDFASFKIAPPPSASSSVSSSFTQVAPATPPVRASNDFMAFSPDKAIKDPFGFAEPSASSVTNQNTPTPFDAFGSPRSASSQQKQSSSSDFDAFGSASATVTSPFDTFGTPAPSSNSSAFDAFGSSSASTSKSSFDAFGGPTVTANTPGLSAFDGFGESTASTLKTNSGVLDDAFSSRTESGSGKIPSAQAGTVPADPFSAFDGIGSGVPTPSPASLSSNIGFGSTTGNLSTGASNSSIGLDFSGQNGVQHTGSSKHTANSDHFDFAGDTKSSNFPHSGPAPFQTPTMPNQFQGFGGAVGGQQMPMQQSQMQMFHPQSQHQQQWLGQHTTQQGGQYPMQPIGQHGVPLMQQPGHLPTSGPAAPTPAEHKPSPDVSTIKDPFAALNIGLPSTSVTHTSGNSSRNTSFEKNPAPPGQPIVFGPPTTASTITPPFPPVNGAATGSFGGGFPPTHPIGTMNSRGNSFDTKPGALPSMPSASPMSSFAYAQPAAPFQPPSQSPVSSFSYPQSSSNQAAFPASDAFGAFTSAPRADSFNTTPGNPQPSANPFDMF